MLKNVLFLVLIIATVSCSKKKEVKHPSLDFRISQSIEIPLVKKNQYSHSQIQLIDSCTFIGLDRKFQKLDIFSICDSTFLKSVDFADDGPNWVYPVTSFQYINKDSIFLFSLDASAFQLIDTESKVLNEWRLHEENFFSDYDNTKFGGLNTFSPISYTENSLHLIPFQYNSLNSSLIFYVAPNSEFGGFKYRETAYNSVPIAFYDIHERAYNRFVGKWPKSYQKPKVPNNVFLQFEKNTRVNDFVVNFSYSPKIFSTLNYKYYKIRSKFDTQDFKLYDLNKEEGYTTEEELSSYHHDEAYVNLVYDPYQNLYYRVFKKSNSENESIKSHFIEAEWSIIVFNEQFEVLGEVLMPKKVYNYLHMLPTPEGLLISKENPYSPSNKEEVYEFDLIEIDL